jgi:nitrogen-specific signal transduction histidine kinase
VDTFIHPPNNEGREHHRFAGVLTDITEQKLLENQLQHTQKMDAIGQLAGGISHDFNNMLGGIVGAG